jgi:hypothetical protein
MDPKPDYGYTSYNGSGKLQGKVAIITGRDTSPFLYKEVARFRGGKGRERERKLFQI